MMAAMLSPLLIAAWPFVTASAGGTSGQPRVAPDPDLGIPEALARERAGRVSNLRYDLAFTIPASRATPIGARVLIRFALASAAEPLVVDYLPDRAGILRSVEANGVRTAIRQVTGHIIVPTDTLTPCDLSPPLHFNALTEP